MEVLQCGEVVRAKGDLHISDAEELKSSLLGALAAAPALVLDLSEVNSCDTASFQLLSALRKSAQRDGKEIKIVGASASVCEASALLGFSLGSMTNAPE
jgi:anti-anti-sigma factor